MPRVFLTEKQRADAKVRNQAKRIIRCLPANYLLAAELGNTQQKQIYRTKEVYPEMLTEAIRVLDLAGYEIVEKEMQ